MANNCYRYNRPRRKGMSRRSLIAGLRAGFLAAMLLAPTTSLFALPGDVLEVIDAIAKGTSTQMGQTVSVKILVTNYSTKEDEKILRDAFRKGQNAGLVKALAKMRPVGRIQIPGTLGYELAFLSSEPTPTGRSIRFLTNRKIAFEEAARNTPSQAYDLTSGQIEIDSQDANKSAGVLYPEAQLTINKDGQFEIQLRKNEWLLRNIIVRKVGQKK
jgi:hypothetical protein